MLIISPSKLYSSEAVVVSNMSISFSPLQAAHVGGTPVLPGSRDVVGGRGRKMNGCNDHYNAVISAMKVSFYM